MFKFISKKINNRKGFTLIELIIVVAILGILAGIAVPRFTNTTATARLNADQVTAKMLVDATSMAIVEGDVTVSDTGDVIVSIQDDLVNEGYLNSVPEPQHEPDTNESFRVEVEQTTGVISVFYADADGDAIGTAIYP